MASSGSLTNQGELDALSVVFSGTLYVGFSTTALDDTSTLANVTEPTDASYSRKSITFTTPATVSGSGQVSNSAAITWPAWVSDATAKITHIFVTDAQTGTTGKIKATWALDVANQGQPVAGQPVSIGQNMLTMSLE